MKHCPRRHLENFSLRFQKQLPPHDDFDDDDDDDDGDDDDETHVLMQQEMQRHVHVRAKDVFFLVF